MPGGSCAAAGRSERERAQRIDAWRKEVRLPPVGRLANYVQVAGQAGLGHADPARIEVRNVNR